MALEFELKYAATEAAQAAIRESLGDNFRVYKMQTTYYDTPDRALAKENITLRRRLENEISVCTLKAPAKVGRMEFELECSTIEDAVPELCKLAGRPDLAVLLASGVVPVCGARFTRQAFDLTLEGTKAELALDTGCLLGDGKEQPLCEVEVELKEGSAGPVVTYAAVLAAKFNLQPEKKSKFARALALAKGE